MYMSNALCFEIFLFHDTSWCSGQSGSQQGEKGKCAPKITYVEGNMVQIQKYDMMLKKTQSKQKKLLHCEGPNLDKQQCT